MKKKIIIAVLLVIVLAVGGVFFAGIFPVARINGEMLWYREFNNQASALERFEAKKLEVASQGELSEEASLTIRKTVLSNIIANQVVKKYIKANLDSADLEGQARQAVEDAVKNTENPDTLPQAAEVLYGWSVDELKENVLYPKALQNELQEEIESKGQNFEQFMMEEIKKSDVKLYFVPWKWEAGVLVDK